MKNRIAVLGRGFLGCEFERAGLTVLGREHFNYPCDMDVLDPYDVVINCIGNADTRGCENPINWGHVFEANAEVVGALSQYCACTGKRFVHISSGCVYDANTSPQREDGFVASHCRYVVSKLAGEYMCLEGDLIIRPRLFFSGHKHINNLLVKLPRFTHHLAELNSFTSTRTIVDAVSALLKYEQAGVFNVAQRGYASIRDICRWVGLEERPTMTAEQLQLDQGLALVNNIMSIEKLERFYEPRDLREEITSCWGLHNGHLRQMAH